MWCCISLLCGVMPVLSQIQIRLADGGQPLSDVAVSAHQWGRVSMSDEQGNVKLPVEWKGEFHLHFEKVGYTAVVRDVIFPLADSIIVYMTSTNIEMKQLVIEDAWSQRMQANRSVMTIQPLSSDMRLNASQNFATTLQYIPGIMAIQTGVGIGKPVIRGMSGARVALIDNGIKQEGQQWGNDHGWELDQYELDHIEIIKGPASLQYGSDAAGGAVVIQPHVWPMKKNEWECRSFYSSNNQREGTSLSYKTKLKIKEMHWALGIRGTLARSEDYQLPTEQYTYLNRTLPLKDGILNNTATQERHLTAWMAMIKGPHTFRLIYRKYHLQSGLFPGIMGVPTLAAVVGDGNASNIGLPSAGVIHDKWMAHYHRQQNNGFWQWEGGAQYNQRAELARPHQDGFAPPNADSLSLQLRLLTFQSNVKKQWRWERGIFMIGGQGQYQRNQRAGVEFLIPSFQQWQAGLYAWLEWSSAAKIGVWSGGLRWDEAGFQTPGFAQFTWNNGVQSEAQMIRSAPLTRRFHAISGAWGWSLTSKPHRILKWNIARSFRMPQAAELTINGVHHGSFRHEEGSPWLQPENGWQADVTVGQQAGNQSWHFSPFCHYYHSYIYLSPQAEFSYLPDGGQLYRYLQAPVFMTGGELFLEKHIWDPLHTDLSVEGVFTYNQKTQLGLPFIPPVMIKSNVVYEKEWREAKTAKLFIHARKAFAQNRTERNEKATPGYFVANAGASIESEMSEIAMEWILSVNNIFNQTYFNNLSNYRWIQLPEQGRWIQVQCCIKIQ